jgi:hypothetical protein
MVLRYCRRCGEVEIVEAEVCDDRAIECGGEDLKLCTRCFVEFREWFFDQSPELTVADSTVATE